MIFQEGISSCRPRAANVSQTIFGIVDTTATKRYMMVMMMVIVIMMMVIIIMMMMVMMMMMMTTLTNYILPSGSPRLPRPQKDEDCVLRQGLEVLPILHLG